MMMMMMSAPMQLTSSAPPLTTSPQPKKIKQEPDQLMSALPPPMTTMGMMMVPPVVDMKACECVGRLSALVEWALSWRNRVENKDQVLSMFSKLLEQVREQKKCLGFCREMFVCRAHWKPHHTTRTRLSSTMPPPSSTSPNDYKTRPWLCTDCDSDDISPPSTPSTTSTTTTTSTTVPIGRHNTVHDYLYWNEQKGGYRTVQSNYNPAINRIVAPQTFQQRAPVQLIVSPKQSQPQTTQPSPPPAATVVMFMIQSESTRRKELIECVLKSAVNPPYQIYLTHLTRDLLSTTPHPIHPSQQPQQQQMTQQTMARVVKGRVAFDSVFGVRPLFYLLDGFPSSYDELELLANETITTNNSNHMMSPINAVFSLTVSEMSIGVIKREGLAEHIFWNQVKQGGTTWVEVTDQASLEATASALLTKLIAFARL